MAHGYTPGVRSRSDNVDWSFARRPFWLFSHMFAAGVIITFVLLGLWQGDRHRERADLNAIIEARANPPAAVIEPTLDGAEPAELDFRYVVAAGTFVDDDFVRVANRTHNGIAGAHVVALFELPDGRTLLVNRGFVPLDTAPGDLDPVPLGTTTITGWLRASAERGWIGAVDSGEGDVVPRLDVDAIAQRLDGAGSGAATVVPAALQLEAAPDRPDLDGGSAAATGGSTTPLPAPVPLPPVDGGPHLSYMVQWFIFATLGVLFYGALLLRTAAGRQRRAPDPPAELDEGSGSAASSFVDAAESVRSEHRNAVGS